MNQIDLLNLGQLKVLNLNIDLKLFNRMLQCFCQVDANSRGAFALYNFPLNFNLILVIEHRK